MADSLLSSSVVVILFEPQDPVNIAATIRAMKNMGVRHASPRAARGVRVGAARGHRAQYDGAHRAHRALRFIRRRRRRLRSRRRLHRAAARGEASGHRSRRARPRELLEAAADGPVALVFGREDSGLPNEVLDRVHAAVTIPTTDHASLNLAQAALIGAVRAAPRRRRRHANARAAAEGRAAGDQRAVRAVLRATPSAHWRRSSSSRRAFPSTSCARYDR